MIFILLPHSKVVNQFGSRRSIDHSQYNHRQSSSNLSYEAIFSYVSLNIQIVEMKMEYKSGKSYRLEWAYVYNLVLCARAYGTPPYIDTYLSTHRNNKSNWPDSKVDAPRSLNSETHRVEYRNTRAIKWKWDHDSLRHQKWRPASHSLTNSFHSLKTEGENIVVGGRGVTRGKSNRMGREREREKKNGRGNRGAWRN